MRGLQYPGTSMVIWTRPEYLPLQRRNSRLRGSSHHCPAPHCGVVHSTQTLPAGASAELWWRVWKIAKTSVKTMETANPSNSAELNSSKRKTVTCLTIRQIMDRSSNHSRCSSLLARHATLSPTRKDHKWFAHLCIPLILSKPASATCPQTLPVANSMV